MNIRLANWAGEAKVDEAFKEAGLTNGVVYNDKKESSLRTLFEYFVFEGLCSGNFFHVDIFPRCFVSFCCSFFLLYEVVEVFWESYIDNCFGGVSDVVSFFSE